jgi:hypothetical protein
MEWIYLESLLALAILAGIVWWTMRARHEPGSDRARERDRPDSDTG